MVPVYGATGRLFFFSLFNYLSHELLRNGEGNGNCTIQDPIARTNDFLLLFVVLSLYVHDA